MSSTSNSAIGQLTGRAVSNKVQGSSSEMIDTWYARVRGSWLFSRLSLICGGERSTSWVRASSSALTSGLNMSDGANLESIKHFVSSASRTAGFQGPRQWQLVLRPNSPVPNPSCQSPVVSPATLDDGLLPTRLPSCGAATPDGSAALNGVHLWLYSSDNSTVVTNQLRGVIAARLTTPNIEPASQMPPEDATPFGGVWPWTLGGWWWGAWPAEWSVTGRPGSMMFAGPRARSRRQPQPALQ